MGGPCISDHMVHATALAHLRRKSTFVNDLLRNESLLDMSSREELYLALFDWLKVTHVQVHVMLNADDQVVSSHESLASMLAMPSMRAVKAEVDEKNPTCKIVTYEGASSPRELLENCVIQATAALKSLQEPPKSASTVKEQLAEKRKLMEELRRTREEQGEAMKAEVDQQASNQDKELLRVFW
jgi:DNA-binding NarL/FixJ family response regulator